MTELWLNINIIHTVAASMEIMYCMSLCVCVSVYERVQPCTVILSFLTLRQLVNLWAKQSKATSYFTFSIQDCIIVTCVD